MTSKRPFNVVTYAATAGMFAVFAIAAGALVAAAYALPIVLLAVIVLTFIALNDAAARRSAGRDDDDPRLPDDTPLGDTAQAHDEISPHDLPPDSPGRRAAERQAARHDGTTRGHEHGAAGGRVLGRDRPGSTS